MGRTSPEAIQRGPWTRYGMTLVESLAAIVITSGMLVASLNLLANAVQARHSRAEMCRAKHLADDLLWEVVTSPYKEPEAAVEQTVTEWDGNVSATIQPTEAQAAVFGPEASEDDGTRRNFDDVDDYNGWTATPPQSKTGTPVPGYEGWTRSVLVEYGSLNDPRNPSGSDTGLAHIIVTVTNPDGRTYSATALRSAAGTFDQAPTIQSDFVTWIGLELEPVGAADPVFSGSGSVNLAE